MCAVNFNELFKHDLPTMRHHDVWTMSFTLFMPNNMKTKPNKHDRYKNHDDEQYLQWECTAWVLPGFGSIAVFFFIFAY